MIEPFWQPLVRNAVLDALAVVFPVECAGCGAPDRALCAECITELQGEPHRQKLADGMLAVSALCYEGSVRAMILAFKEHGRTDLVRPLSRALCSAFDAAAVDASDSAGAADSITRIPLEVCPVPATRQAARRRGYRPVELLLRGARLRSASVLTVTNDTAEQKSLGIAEREGNLHGSFRATAPLHGRRFLIVDDIVTTGATLIEAARAITAGGGEVVGAVTLAFTARRVPRLGRRVPQSARCVPRLAQNQAVV